MSTDTAARVPYNPIGIAAPPGAKPKRYLDIKHQWIEKALPVAVEFHLAVLTGQKEATQIQADAYRIAMEYAWGKPKQVEEHTGIIGIVTADQLIERRQQAALRVAEYEAKLLNPGQEVDVEVTEANGSDNTLCATQPEAESNWEVVDALPPDTPGAMVLDQVLDSNKPKAMRGFDWRKCVSKTQDKDAGKDAENSEGKGEGTP